MIIKVRQPIVWFVLSLICGIYLRLGVSLLICLVCFSYFIFSFVYLASNKFYKMAFAVISSFIIGFLISGARYNPPNIADEDFNFQTWQGDIYETSLSVAGNQKLYVNVPYDKNNLKIYILWTGEEVFTVGDVISFNGMLQHLSTPSNKGAFNEKMYFSSLDIDYKIFPEEIVLIDTITNINSIRYSIKEGIFVSIDEFFPQHQGGVLKAMLTGIDDYILPETKDLYTRAGINHILCISGLHISVMSLMINFFLHHILRFSQRISTFFTCIFSILLLVFIGFTPALCRATIMTVCVLSGKLLFEKPAWTNILSLAMGCVLLIRPLDLWNVGFQLSFITVAGICISAKIVRNTFTKLNFLKSVVAVSVYASLFSFPIIAYHFYSISLIGLIINLLITPFTTLLIISSILTCLIGTFLPIVGEMISFIPSNIFNFIDFLAIVATEIPFSYILIGSPALSTILIYYILIIHSSYYTKNLYNQIVIPILMVGLFLSMYSNQFIFKENTIAFLDVGQGDSTVITTYDKKAIVVDGGGIFGKDIGSNTGVTVVKPYLNYLGISEIDAVFITHFDRDHVLGAIELCDIMPVKGVYISRYPFDNLTYWEELRKIIDDKNIPLYTVMAGDEFIWGDYGEFQCLAPQEGIYYSDGDDNHGSLVIKYTYGGLKTLLMGDATEEDEDIILSEGYNVSADILKLGHHGSKYSSGELFLEEVNASIGIVSCGFNNRYNHPHFDVLYRTQDMEIYRTDTMGSVFLEIKPSGKYSIEGIGQVKSIYARIQGTAKK